MRIGQEAREFMDRYALREDAVLYAAAHPAIEEPEDEHGYRLVFGHDPQNRRLRLTIRGDVILTVRPVPDVR